jgi:hypothetical protein
MYAETASGRAEAAKGLQGTCPSCAAPVRPKCGSIVVHHWAHHARGECDPWSEPEGEWHRGWKLAVPPERREVVMGPHRADVVTASGGVVELQHSPISPEVIAEREAFYGERMAWIFDATPLDPRVPFAPRVDILRDGRSWDQRPGGRHSWREIARAAADRQEDFLHHLFRWPRARKSVAACERAVLLDLGGGLVLRIGKFYADSPAGGWGTLLTRESVEGWLRDGTPWDALPVVLPPPPPPARPARYLSPLMSRHLSDEAKALVARVHAPSAKMKARRAAYERRWGWSPERAREELLPYRRDA